MLTALKTENNINEASQRLKQNNFDFLRLLFALYIFCAHALDLSGQKAFICLTNICSAKYALESFFTMSGFLIFMSFERSSSISSFLLKRARRIYPNYFVVVVLFSLLLWGISSLDGATYFSSEWLKYLLANLTFLNFLHPTLPNVFTENPLNAVNGALWTLKVDVMFYLSVPAIIYLFNRFGRLPVLLVLYWLSIGYSWTTLHIATTTGSHFWLLLSHQFPAQLSFFLAGACIYYYRMLFERYLPYLITASISIFCIQIFYSIFYLEPLALAVLVCFIGLYGYLGNFSKYGDFSYGFYLIHFPIIQCFVYFGWFQQAPFLSFLAAGAITLAGAICLWYGVEKRFLPRNNHYVTQPIFDYNRPHESYRLRHQP